MNICIGCGLIAPNNASTCSRCGGPLDGDHRVAAPEPPEGLLLAQLTLSMSCRSCGFWTPICGFWTPINEFELSGSVKCRS